MTSPATKPWIDAHDFGATLVLKPAPNGGYIVQQKNPKRMLGAFSTRAEMFEALRSGLFTDDTLTIDTVKLDESVLAGMIGISAGSAVVKATGKKSKTSGTLMPIRENEYVGYGYGALAMRAREVCRIAGETGQTMLALDHLKVIIPLMESK